LCSHGVDQVIMVPIGHDETSVVASALRDHGGHRGGGGEHAGDHDQQRDLREAAQSLVGDSALRAFALARRLDRQAFRLRAAQRGAQLARDEGRRVPSG
jgi:hypothetical protein